MGDERARALRELYRVLATPLAGPVVGCPHCVDPAAGVDLCRLSRTDATAEQLHRYAFKAMTTWGDVDDFKWFLPRLLELAGELDFDLVLGKVAYAHWTEWPARERDAVRAFLLAEWHALFAAFPSLAPSFAIALEAIEPDLGPYLASLHPDRERAHLLHVATLLDEHAQSILQRGTLAGRDAGALFAFVTANERARELDEGFFASANPEEAELLSRARDVLAWR